MSKKNKKKDIFEDLTYEEQMALLNGSIDASDIIEKYSNGGKRKKEYSLNDVIPDTIASIENDDNMDSVRDTLSLLNPPINNYAEDDVIVNDSITESESTIVKPTMLQIGKDGSVSAITETIHEKTVVSKSEYSRPYDENEDDEDEDDDEIEDSFVSLDFDETTGYVTFTDGIITHTMCPNNVPPCPQDDTNCDNRIAVASCSWGVLEQCILQMIPSAVYSMDEFMTKVLLKRKSFDFQSCHFYGMHINGVKGVLVYILSDSCGTALNNIVSYGQRNRNIFNFLNDMQEICYGSASFEKSLKSIKSTTWIEDLESDLIVRYGRASKRDIEAYILEHCSKGDNPTQDEINENVNNILTLTDKYDLSAYVNYADEEETETVENDDGVEDITFVQPSAVPKDAVVNINETTVTTTTVTIGNDVPNPVNPELSVEDQLMSGFSDDNTNDDDGHMFIPINK